MELFNNFHDDIIRIYRALTLPGENLFPVSYIILRHLTQISPYLYASLKEDIGNRGYELKISLKFGCWFNSFQSFGFCSKTIVPNLLRVKV